MILLHRVYSDTNLFDEVEFIEGINVVLGKYSGEEEGREVNGIGKSTLVRLIDFALLSDSSKSFFPARKYKFLHEHNYNFQSTMSTTRLKENSVIPKWFIMGKKENLFMSILKLSCGLFYKTNFLKPMTMKATWVTPGFEL